jgi:hypothetical protein
MGNIGKARWNKYKNLINKIHKEFNQDTLTWRKHTPQGVTQFNEGIENNYEDFELKILIGYNSYRTWPITKHNQDTGEIDNQNLVVYINVSYLKELGYTDQHGYFQFNPANDKFIHRGIIYKGEGDTFLSQASDEPLLFILVLRREEEITGKSRFN